MRPWHPLLDGLAAPLRWRSRVQVRVTQDLFLGETYAFIDQVFAVMMLAPMHTFKVATKDPFNMGRYMEQKVNGASVVEIQNDILQKLPVAFATAVCKRLEEHTGRPATNPHTWPPTNVYLYGELRP